MKKVKFYLAVLEHDRPLQNACKAIMMQVYNFNCYIFDTSCSVTHDGLHPTERIEAGNPCMD